MKTITIPKLSFYAFNAEHLYQHFKKIRRSVLEQSKRSRTKISFSGNKIQQYVYRYNFCKNSNFKNRFWVISKFTLKIENV